MSTLRDPFVQRTHGGPDSAGTPRFDFSTNSNACGPCPQALLAVQQADATSYPDASYAQLREALAAFHGVDVARIVLAGSASEFIFRFTAVAAKQAHEKGRNPASVSLPPHSYGDYAQAAHAWGLATSASPDGADLVWACEPSSPLGQAHALWPGSLGGGAFYVVSPARCAVSSLTYAERSAPQTPRSLRPEEPKEFKQAESNLVLDRAYEPLRLEGNPSLSADQLNRVWQLWTPNKALGLTGIRAAYAIAPVNQLAMVDALEAMAPSWPVGAHGEVLLKVWVQPEVQQWLAGSLLTLTQWKTDQIALLQSLGWTCLPSEANFFCAQPAQSIDVNRLRERGIKLRDAASFGLPGYFRLSVQGPEAQAALQASLQVMVL